MDSSEKSFLRRWWHEFWTSLKESVFEPEWSEADALVAPSLCRASHHSIFEKQTSSEFKDDGADNLSSTSRLHCREDDESRLFIDGNLVVLEGVAGTVPYRVLAGTGSSSSSEQEAGQVKCIVESILAEVMEALDPFDENSEASKLCASAEKSWIEVSRHLGSALVAADFLFEATSGLFDVSKAGAHSFRSSRAGETLEKSSKEQHQVLEQEKQQEHQEEASSSGGSKMSAPKLLSWKESFTLEYDRKSHQEDSASGCRGPKEEKGQILRKVLVKRLSEHVALDCCAVAKGHFCSEVVKALRSAGYRSALCSWGGEVCACGQHPEGRPWRLEIPKSPSLPTIYKEWQAAEREGRSMWGTSNDSSVHRPSSKFGNSNFFQGAWPSVSHELLEASQDTEALWHLASSGGWARPKKHGLTELIGENGSLSLQNVPTVAVLLREPIACTKLLGLNDPPWGGSGALADGMATAAAAAGSIAGAVKVLEAVQERLEVMPGHFRSWVFPAPAPGEPGDFPGPRLRSGQNLRDHIATHAGRQLSLVVCLTKEGVLVSLNTTVICASLEPPMMSFYLARPSPLLLLLKARELCLIISLRACDADVANWLAGRGGTVLLKCRKLSNALGKGGHSWFGCARRSSFPQSEGFLEAEWPFFDFGVKFQEGGFLLVPATKEDESGWLACEVHSQSSVGANLLVICSVQAMSDTPGTSIHQPPLLRWNRQLTTVSPLM